VAAQGQAVHYILLMTDQDSKLTYVHELKVCKDLKEKTVHKMSFINTHRNRAAAFVIKAVLAGSPPSAH